MNKYRYIIYWDAGYGMEFDLSLAKNKDMAEKEAYDLWKEDVEANADYGCEEYSEERAEELGFKCGDE